jgi:hypothetical protein
MLQVFEHTGNIESGEFKKIMALANNWFGQILIVQD